MITWLTSAAIVALVTATILFPWHRSVEEAIAIRKEKRELYRDFLKTAKKASRLQALTEPEGRDLIDVLDGKYSEVSLICDWNTSSEIHDYLMYINGLSKRFMGKDLLELMKDQEVRASLEELGRQSVVATHSLKLDIEATKARNPIEMFRKTK